jgi:hypothetical protein
MTRAPLYRGGSLGRWTRGIPAHRLLPHWRVRLAATRLGRSKRTEEKKTFLFLLSETAETSGGGRERDSRNKRTTINKKAASEVGEKGEVIEREGERNHEACFLLRSIRPQPNPRQRRRLYLCPGAKREVRLGSWIAGSRDARRGRVLGCWCED